MSLTIKLRQGLKAAIPVSGMTQGEPLYCTDSQELYIATSATTKAPVVMDLESLSAMVNTDVAASDLLFMYDVSQTSGTVKARKITFTEFKTALNIPAGSTDEKVAVKSGQTAGYLYQASSGNDGILRAGTGIGFTDSNTYITAAIYFSGEAQGNIIYRGASAWGVLAPSAGFLTSGGAGTNPAWSTTVDGGTF